MTSKSNSPLVSRARKLMQSQPVPSSMSQPTSSPPNGRPPGPVEGTITKTAQSVPGPITSPSASSGSTTPTVPPSPPTLPDTLQLALDKLARTVISSSAKPQAPALTSWKPSAEWRRTNLCVPEHRHVSLKRMAEATEAFLRRAYYNIREPWTLLVLTGPPGTRKTYCAQRGFSWLAPANVRAWDRGYWKRPINVTWARWSRVIASPKEDLYEDLVRSDVVFLDDVGTEVDQFASGRPIEVLRALLEERHKRFTILTTNIAPADWDKRWDARVADRLIRHSLVIDTKGAPKLSGVSKE